MAHLSSLSLERFRTFRHPATFDLAPLTIITGPNSSGKSSILKALLLLKESASTHYLDRLSFGSGIHGLTSFPSARTRGTQEDIQFTVAIEDALGDDVPTRMAAEIQQETSRDNGEGQKLPFDWPSPLYFTMHFSADRSEYIKIEADTGAGRELICELSQYPRISPLPPDDEVEDFIPEVVINGQWFLQQFGRSSEDVASALRATLDSEFIEFCNLIDRSIRFTGKGYGAPHYLYPSRILELIRSGECDFGLGIDMDIEMSRTPYFERFRHYTLYPLMYRCVKALLDTLSSLEYVSSRQNIAQRVFQPEGQTRSFFELLQAIYQADDWSKSFALTGCNKWLKQFEIGDELEIQKVEDLAYTAHIQDGNELIPVADLGSGHSRLLPLILHIGLKRDPTTLLVEEPEANLHPNLQSRLADLFIDLVGDVDKYDTDSPHYRSLFKVDPETDESFLELEFDPDTGRVTLPDSEINLLTKRLIVETHSEYVIRRLQYLVATGKANPDRIVIYYLGPDPEADDYIRQIRIAPTGQLSKELGPGFMDEATNLMVDLYNQAHQN